jgi:hypothetical protein
MIRHIERHVAHWPDATVIVNHHECEFIDPNFMRMAYEIAFTEYAIVLAQELSSAQYYFDPQDALVEVRQTLDDLSKAFASVWRSPGVTH